MGRRGSFFNQSGLSNARNSANLTGVCGSGGDAQLASAASVPLSSVHKGQCRGKRVNDAVIIKIATALGVNPNAIK